MRQTHAADGTRLAYRLFGPREAPPVALLDGISCDGFIFRDLDPWLAERARVLHLHYRGHGRSGLPRDPEACTLPDLAGDVAELLDRSRLGPAVLIGHSMGVQVALEAALRHPERVRGLVLMCGAHGRVLDTFKHTDLGRRVLPWLERTARGGWREPLARAVRALLPTRMSYALAAWSEVKGDRLSEDDLMPYLEHFARMPLDLFSKVLTDAAERTSEAWLGRVSQPTLILAGEDDGFTPVHLSRALAAALPDARLEVVPGASHTGPLERPDAFRAAIAAFLDGLSAEPSGPSTPRPPLAETWRANRLR